MLYENINTSLRVTYSGGTETQDDTSYKQNLLVAKKRNTKTTVTINGFYYKDNNTMQIA